MRILFVGMGSIGQRHLENLCTILDERNMEYEIHLLRATDRVLSDSILKHISKSIYEQEQLEEQYDIIFITNPTYLHYETLLEMNHRSNVFFIEKPIFDKFDIDVSVFDSEMKKIYYVACPLRYSRVLQRGKELLADEKVCSVRAISSSYLPQWRKNCDYRNTYSAHKEQGGGVQIDLIHEWDYLVDLFGFPLKTRQLAGKYSNLEINSDDLAVYVGEYSDKLVELHLDYFGRYTRRSCEVITEKAVYILDIANSCIYKDNQIMERFNETANEKYVEELKYFLKLIAGECSNTNNMEHALHVLKLAMGEI